MVAKALSARGLALLVLLLLAAEGCQEQPREGGADVCRPAAQELTDAELTAYVLLELSSPAVRYLRAFTVPCWRPAPPPPSGPRLDGTWAVALVTLWNDLTSPNNGLGRLVTAQQLHAEAAAMLGEERYSDSLAILELSVLLRLYPFQPPGQLAAWQRGMTLAGAAHPRVRLQLARTLVLVARARAGAGAAGVATTGALTKEDLELLEGAVLAAEAALALFQTEGVRHEDGPADPSQLPELRQRIAQQVAAVLHAMPLQDLRALAEERGVAGCAGCAQRRGLLEALLPAVRVPLQLAEVAARGGVVAVLPDLRLAPRYAAGQHASELELYKAVVADVMTLLPPTLLAEVGVDCQGQPGAGCHSAAAAAVEAQARALKRGRGAQGEQSVDQLLRHADTVEEVLWRLEECLLGAAVGVRMADGTTWLRQAGWNWQLTPFLEARLYPPGVAPPEHSDVWEKPPGAEQVCLDKTFLLDTVVRLDVEELQGVQYALDNLHYAQSSVGGPERFWVLAGSEQLDLGMDFSQRMELADLLVGQYRGGAASAPVDLAGVLAGASGGGGPGLPVPGALGLEAESALHDPFIAAFFSLCVLGAASLYVYGNRHSLSAVLVLQRSGGSGSSGGDAPTGGRSVAQRNAATAALREALAAGDSRRLTAAIDAADEAGVEKLLLKKARTALQALRRKRAQQGSSKQAPSGGGGGNSSARPVLSPSSSSSDASNVQSSEQVAKSAGSAGARVAGPGRSKSIGRSLSESAASLIHAAWDAERAAAAAAAAAVPAPAALGSSEAAGATSSKRKGKGDGSALQASAPSKPGPPGWAGRDVPGAEAAAAACATAPAEGRAQQPAQSGGGGGRRPEGPISLTRNISSESSEPPTSPGTPMEAVYSRSTPGGADSVEPPSPRAPSPTLDTPEPSPKPAAVAPPPPAPAAQAAKAPQQQQQHHHHNAAPAQPAPTPGQSPAPRRPASPPNSAAKPAEAPSPKVIVAPRPQRTSPSKRATASPSKHAQAAGAKPAGAAAKAMTPPPPPPPATAAGGSGGRKAPGAGGASPQPSPPIPRAAARQRPAAAAASPPAPEATVTFVPTTGQAQQVQQDMPQKSQSALLIGRGGKAVGLSQQGVQHPFFQKRSLSDSARPGRGSGALTAAGEVAVRPPPPPPPRNLAPGAASAGAPPAVQPSLLPPPPPSSAPSSGSLESSSPRMGPGSGGSSPYAPGATAAGGAGAKSWPRMNPAAPAWAQENRAAEQLYHQPSAQVDRAARGPPSPFDVGASGGAARLQPAASPPQLLSGDSSPHQAAAPSLFDGAELSGGSLFEGGGLGSGSRSTPSRTASGVGLFGAAATAESASHPPGPTLGRNPDLLASLQQIWSGSGAGQEGGGGGGVGGAGAGAGAAAYLQRTSPVAQPGHGLVRSLSVPRPARQPLEAGGGLGPGALAARQAFLSNEARSLGGAPGAGGLHSLFDPLLAPAPELALWAVGGGEPRGVPVPGGGRVAGREAAGHHFSATCPAGGRQGSLGESLAAEEAAAGGAAASGSGEEEVGAGMSMDLASLGFTELGD